MEDGSPLGCVLSLAFAWFYIFYKIISIIAESISHACKQICKANLWTKVKVILNVILSICSYGIIFLLMSMFIIGIVSLTPIGLLYEKSNHICGVHGGIISAVSLALIVVWTIMTHGACVLFEDISIYNKALWVAAMLFCSSLLTYGIVHFIL